MARLDLEMVSRGLVRSRSSAQSLISNGFVLVDGKQILKHSKEVSKDNIIDITQTEKYVSRGGYKLEKAILFFKLNFKDKTILDIGASTGGFTDCSLQAGARKVFAVDVGTGQFNDKLSTDSRVELYEQTDIRKLKLNAEFDFIVVDVSFISIKNIIEDIYKFLKADGKAVILVKPQFEVGKKNLNRQGIVKDKNLYNHVMSDLKILFENKSFAVSEFIESPILGGTGNKEFLVCVTKSK